MALGWVLSSSAAAQAEPSESIYVSAVVFEGLVDTRRDLVQRVLDVEAGQRVTRDKIARGVRRLLNTGLFASADWELVDESVHSHTADVAVLRVRLHEHISVRPVFAFERGRDRSRLLLGARETNALGRGVEVGARVELIDHVTTVDARLYAPWLLGGRVYSDLQLDYGGRPQRVVDASTSFVRTRRHGAAEVGAHVRDWLRVGMALSSSFDRYEGLPLPTTRRVEAGLVAHLEAVRREGFVYHGAASTLGGYTSVNAESRQHVDLGARGYVELPWRSNLAVQARVGLATLSHVGDDYFVGGLGQLRVGVDGAFHGPSYWVANSELRVPSLQTSWVTLQHVAFCDVAAVSAKPSGWRVLDELAAGAGLRIISPALGHLTFRADIGWSLLGGGPPQLSFGTGQFF